MNNHEPAIKAGGRRKGKPVPHKVAAKEDNITPQTNVQQALSTQGSVNDLIVANEGNIKADPLPTKGDIQHNPKAVASTYNPPPAKVPNNKHVQDKNKSNPRVRE